MGIFWWICVISALVVSPASAIINNYATSPEMSIYRLRHKGVDYRATVKGSKRYRTVYIVPEVDGIAVSNEGGKQDESATQEMVSTSGPIRQPMGKRQESIEVVQPKSPRRVFVSTGGQHANQFPGINHLKIEREPPRRNPGGPSKNPHTQYITIRPSFVPNTNATADKGIPENHPNSHLSPNLRPLPIQSSPSTLHLFHPLPPESPTIPHPTNFPTCDVPGKLGIHDRHPPPDPYIQLALSHYGAYGWPLAYGYRYGGLYGYAAGNDIHNNQPIGSYKVTEEYD